MVPPNVTNFISDAISRHGSKKYQSGHLCISGLKLLATTVTFGLRRVEKRNTITFPRVETHRNIRMYFDPKRLS